MFDLKPETIRQARKDAARNLGLSRPLSQVKSAALVHVAPQSWRDWESGKHNMPLGLFELFLIQTGQLKSLQTDCKPLYATFSELRYPTITLGEKPLNANPGRDSVSYIQKRGNDDTESTSR